MRNRTILCCLVTLVLASGCATLDAGQTTVANEARKSQAAKLGQLLELIGQGKLRLGDEMTVAPSDPRKPMVNVRVSVRRAPDARVMLALVGLADMSRYQDPATIADVLIALIGGAKEVAIKGLDQLPWFWGFDALKTALDQRGYQVHAGDHGTIVLGSSQVDAARVTTGDHGTVALHSTDTRAHHLGRDYNQGGQSGSDRDKAPTQSQP